MGTFDITLPINKRVVFPPACVVCEKPNPNSKMKISILGANTGSLTEEVVDNVLDIGVGGAINRNTNTKFEGIPICSGCEFRLKWYHRLLKFATYTIWLPALGLMLFMSGPMFIRVIIFLAIIIAPPILSMIFPPAFGATVLNGKANYEFKSKTIADEFRRLNCPPEAPVAESGTQNNVAGAA